MKKNKYIKTMQEIRSLVEQAKRVESKEYKEGQFMVEFYECIAGTEATTDDYLFREFLRTVWRELRVKKDIADDRKRPFSLTYRYDKNIPQRRKSSG